MDACFDLLDVGSKGYVTARDLCRAANDVGLPLLPDQTAMRDDTTTPLPPAEHLVEWLSNHSRRRDDEEDRENQTAGERVHRSDFHRLFRPPPAS